LPPDAPWQRTQLNSNMGLIWPLKSTVSAALATGWKSATASTRTAHAAIVECFIIATYLQQTNYRNWNRSPIQFRNLGRPRVRCYSMDNRRRRRPRRRPRSPSTRSGPRTRTATTTRTRTIGIRKRLNPSPRRKGRAGISALPFYGVTGLLVAPPPFGVKLVADGFAGICSSSSDL
jgi:hypothetical protein